MLCVCPFFLVFVVLLDVVLYVDVLLFFYVFECCFLCVVSMYCCFCLTVCGISCFF